MAAKIVNQSYLKSIKCNNYVYFFKLLKYLKNNNLEGIFDKFSSKNFEKMY